MRCAQLSSGWSVKKLIWKDSCTKFLFTVNFFPSHSITNTVPEMCRHHTKSSWSKNSPRATSLRLSIFYFLFFFVVVRLFSFFLFYHDVTLTVWEHSCFDHRLLTKVLCAPFSCSSHSSQIPRSPAKNNDSAFHLFFFFHFGSKEEIYERRKTFGLCFPNPARQITTCWRGCMGL